MRPNILGHMKTDVCSTSTNPKPVHNNQPINLGSQETDVCSTRTKPKPSHCIFQLLYCEHPCLGRGLCFEDAISLTNGFTLLWRGRCKFLLQVQKWENHKCTFMKWSRTVRNLQTKWNQSNIEDVAQNPLHRPKADPLGVC